jgi:drug/metabolite transporter (DMT)-like permease
MPIPLNILLALCAAAFWGIGDFSGGMSVQSAPNPTHAGLRTVLFSHLTSISLLVALPLLLHQPFPTHTALAWGLAAGVIAALSLSAFYTALSRGAMGASAAISGLLAAAIPATVSLALEGSPGTLRIAGFLLAAVAIWLITAGPAQREALHTILLATFAGIAFGLYFVFLKLAAATSTSLWTLATARTASIATCTALLLFVSKIGKNARHSERSEEPLYFDRTGTPSINWNPAGWIDRNLPRRMLLWVLSTALFDTSGNLLFVAATRAGRLDVASVLASLYPASTILLAAAVLHERPTGRQIAGMAVVLAAVVLITL